MCTFWFELTRLKTPRFIYGAFMPKPPKWRRIPSLLNVRAGKKNPTRQSPCRIEPNQSPVCWVIFCRLGTWQIADGACFVSTVFTVGRLCYHLAPWPINFILLPDFTPFTPRANGFHLYWVWLYHLHQREKNCQHCNSSLYLVPLICRKLINFIVPGYSLPPLFTTYQLRLFLLRSVQVP